MNNLAIIDADSLLYFSSKETIYESIATIDERIRYILADTESDRFYLFLSQGPYFRHEINPEYKANRKKTYGTPLKYLQTLKMYLREQWNAFSVKGLEADDLVAYMYGNYEEAEEEKGNKVMCAVDKDLLKSIKGKHYNYTWKLHNKGTASQYTEKGSWVETSGVDAASFFIYQLLKGDAGDNVKGIPGKNQVMKDYFKLDNRPGFGDLSVKKVMDTLGKENTWVYNVMLVYQMYYGPIQGVYEYQKVFRQIRLLHDSVDMNRELGYIPEIPVANKIEDFQDFGNSQEQKEEHPLF